MEEKIIKQTENGWKVKLPRRKWSELILTNRRLIIGKGLEEYRRSIPLKDIRNMEVKTRFLNQPQLKMDMASETLTLDFSKQGSASLLRLWAFGADTHDIRIQSYIFNWIMAINQQVAAAE